MSMRTLSAALVLATFALALPVAGSAAGFDPEGKYALVEPPQPTSVPKDKVEVVDVFWYGCPHCWHLLPLIEKYEKDKPDYVVVRHMPAIFNELWKLHARAFYTADLLGVSQRLHRPIFEAIHERGDPLDTEAKLRAFFAKHGVAPADFDKTFHSFAVEQLLNKSVVMQRRYGVRGTPTIIVNGKYRVSASLAGDYETMMKVVAALAEREHKAELAAN